MPSLSLPDRLIWFAHCPKAGGTSIEHVMVRTWGAQVGHLFWGWDLWFRQGGWRETGPPCSPQHLIWEDALGTLEKVPDRVFALVRDPVERMASEHRWQRRGRRATRLGRAVARLPFPLWLRLMLAMRRRHPYAFDNHLRPQTDFVPETAVVFRLEDGLETPLDWLARQAGTTRPAVLPHALASGGSRSVEPCDRALVALAFASDYARFGYRAETGRAATRPLTDLLVACLAPALVAADRRGWL